MVGGVSFTGSYELCDGNLLFQTERPGIRSEGSLTGRRLLSQGLLPSDFGVWVCSLVSTVKEEMVFDCSSRAELGSLGQVTRAKGNKFPSSPEASYCVRYGGLG